VTWPPGPLLDGVAVSVIAAPVTVTALDVANTALPLSAINTKS
jgi:hypothetical protein